MNDDSDFFAGILNTEDPEDRKTKIENCISVLKNGQAALIRNYGWDLDPDKFLAAIVECSEDAIIGKALDGTILSWNRAAEGIYGYSENEIIGRPVTILAPEDKKQELVRFLELIRNGKSVDGIETSRIRKDGSRIDVFVKISPIFDSSGIVIGASTIARDITERIAREKELERNRKKASVQSREIKILLKIQKLTEELDRPIDEMLLEIAKSIPDLWEATENIGVRLHLGKYKISHNLPDDRCIIQRTGIKHNGRNSGFLEIFYAEGFGGPGDHDLKSIKLVESLAGIIGRFYDRRVAVDKLRAVHTQLVTEQLTLNKKNQAMKEILEQFEGEKKKLKRRFQANIDHIISPLIKNLKIRLQNNERQLVSALEEALHEISSDFIGELEIKFKQLTPRELEVCNLIKKGMSTKEIAELLGISDQTVAKQRTMIRKKLGLVKQRVNITSYLRSIDFNSNE